METLKKKIKKNLIFRLNLNNKIGVGHLIRCLRLAKKIKNKYEVIFVFDKLSKKFPINNYLENFKIIDMYNNKKFKNERIDSKIFLSKFQDIKIDTVIVDDYRIGKIWHKEVKKKIKKLIVIDDLLDREFYCDYYINYKFNKDNSLLKKARKYCNKSAKLIIGDKYCIIDPKLKKKKSLIKKLNILINFGNDFNFNLVKKILTKLITTRIKEKFNIIICVGILGKNYEYLFSLKKKFRNIKIIYKKIFIEDQINKSHIYFGSCGNALYEMSYLNIPSIFFSLTKNQKNSIEDLENYGHYFLLNKIDLNKIETIDLIKNFINKYKRISKLNNTKKIFLKKNGIKQILTKTKIL